MINTLIPLIHPIPSRSTFCSGFGVAALECHPLIDSSALAHPKLGSETPRLPGYPRGGLSFLLNVPEICTWCCFYVQLRSKWSNKVQIQRELQLHQFFGTKKWRGKILTWLAGSGCLLHVFCWKTFRPRPPYWKRNLFEFPVGKEIMDAPTWLEMGFYRRVACNSVEVSFCVPGSAACGSTCRRKGLVTSLCWFASIHFYLRLLQDFVFYRKSHPFQDRTCRFRNCSSSISLSLAFCRASCWSVDLTRQPWFHFIELPPRLKSTNFVTWQLILEKQEKLPTFQCLQTQICWQVASSSPAMSSATALALVLMRWKCLGRVTSWENALNDPV